MAVVIHAPNVHRGGGRVLLLSLLDALANEGAIRLILLDVRMELPGVDLGRFPVYRVMPSLLGRLRAELKLREVVGAGDSVLCLGNLPPLFKSAGRAVVFLQNRYLVEKTGLRDLEFKTRLRVRFERLWLKVRRSTVDRIVVQTPSMQRAVQKHLGATADMLPFADGASNFSRAREGGPTGCAVFDFVYVASGEPHKNHRVLIEAWSFMARDGVRPSLCLTIDQETFPELLAFIKQEVDRHDLRIENRGHLPVESMKTLYLDAKALIYPSTMESLGLPLIEARCLGLAVLASELDYVRDVIDPEDTFDPTSSLSIARAVKRFLDIKEPHLPLMDAQSFLAAVLKLPDRRDEG